jgi:hypothetical protein
MPGARGSPCQSLGTHTLPLEHDSIRHESFPSERTKVHFRFRELTPLVAIVHDLFYERGDDWRGVAARVAVNSAVRLRQSRRHEVDS